MYLTHESSTATANRPNNKHSCCSVSSSHMLPFSNIGSVETRHPPAPSSSFRHYNPQSSFQIFLFVVLFSSIIQLSTSFSEATSLSSTLFNSPKPIQISSTLEIRIDSFNYQSSIDIASGRLLLRICARQHDAAFDYQSLSSSAKLWSGDAKQACPLGRTAITSFDAQVLPLTAIFSSSFSWPESFALIVELADMTGEDNLQGSGVLIPTSSSPSASDALLSGNEAATIKPAKLSNSETNESDAAAIIVNDDGDEEADTSMALSTAVQRRIILRMVVHRSGLLPSSNWSVESLSQGGASLTLAYRLRCANDLYGTTCTKYCLPRDNDFGHYTCDLISGYAKCLSGWTSDSQMNTLPCTAAVCKQNCSQVGGFCEKPGQCSCREGWTGENCDVCRTKPTCKHGTCLKPGDCICDNKWTGENCDKPVNLCATSGQRCMENGGQCRNLKDGSYECICPFRRSGKDCDIVTSFCNSSPCLNGGTCIDIDEKPGFICSCSSLATGPTCEQLLNRPVKMSDTITPFKDPSNKGDTASSSNAHPSVNIALIVDNGDAGSKDEVAAAASPLSTTHLALIVVFGITGPVSVILVFGVICALRARRRRLELQQQQRQIIVHSSAGSSLPTVCTIAIAGSSTPNYVSNRSGIGAFPPVYGYGHTKPSQPHWGLLNDKSSSTAIVDAAVADNMRNIQRKTNNTIQHDLREVALTTTTTDNTKKLNRPMSWLHIPSGSSSSSSTASSLSPPPDAFSSTTMDLIHTNYPTLGLGNTNNTNLITIQSSSSSKCQHENFYHVTPHQQIVPPFDFAIDTNNGNYDLPPPPYSPASAFTLEDCV